MADRSGCFSVIFLLLLFSVTQCCDTILEEGESKSFTCRININTTWHVGQVRVGREFISILNCSFLDMKCTSQEPSLYRGSFENSAKGTGTLMTFLHANRNETGFRCLFRNQIPSNICVLEVYVRPSEPVCDPVRLDNTEKHLEVKCRTDNVYPSAKAVLRMREAELSPSDVISSDCSYGPPGSGSLGDVAVECTWRISVASMNPRRYSFYVEMSATVSDFTKVTKPAAVSKDVSVLLSIPVAAIDGRNCPGVNEGFIVTGPTATCRCELQTFGFPPGQARWYTASGSIVGQENITDRSSTLTVSRGLTDCNKIFECTAVNPLKTSTIRFMYTPVFASSAPPSTITGLQHLVIILGAVCAGIASLLV